MQERSSGDIHGGSKLTRQPHRPEHQSAQGHGLQLLQGQAGRRRRRRFARGTSYSGHDLRRPTCGRRAIRLTSRTDIPMGASTTTLSGYVTLKRWCRCCQFRICTAEKTRATTPSHDAGAHSFRAVRNCARRGSAGTPRDFIARIHCGSARAWAVIVMPTSAKPSSAATGTITCAIKIAGKAR